MGRKGRRRRLDSCIYQDATGCAVKVKVHGAQQELRFPLDTDLEVLRTQRDQLRLDLRAAAPGQAARGTLAHDAVKYCKQIAGRPGSAADRSHLRAWIDRLGPKMRGRITAADVRLALAAWRTAGTFTGGRGTRTRHALEAPASEKTLQQRWRVLRHLYKLLDGPTAKTPCDEVPRPKPPAATPVGVPIDRVTRVALALKQRARWTPLHSPARQDYARYLLLVTTGQRPAQLQRAIAEDFDLRKQFWIVRGAKGGPTHAIHLNAEMRVAVQQLLAAGALGPYDTSQLLAVARAHGWPKAIPLYNARHSVAIDAIEAGADLGDLQALLGHASIDTTRRFYGPILRMRQKRIGKKLEGRLQIS
jgi:integrase